MLDIKFLGFVLICIGIGSTLFHATLLYEAQLLDELPMHWLVSYASILLYTRNDWKVKVQRTSYFYTICTVFEAALVVILTNTQKNSSFHQVLRLIMSASFGLEFVYLFYVGAKIGNEVYEKDPNNRNYRKINEYYDKAFVFFVIALIGWLCDNWNCQILQNLKVFGMDLPYMHFHAILWHIGTCIGLHYFMLVVIAHRLVFEYDADMKCTTILGVLPFIRVDEKAD